MNRRMLYELTKAAFVHADLRSDLMPLVSLGHEARVASREIDLRGLVIRTAYEAKSPALRRVLLESVITADRSGHCKQADARNRGRYRPAFLRWIANRDFPNPNPEGRKQRVVFNSLPSEEQSRIYQEWQQGRLDWAQRHKPQGLGPETRITVENFNEIRPGDVIWRSDSPVKLHRVTAVDREGRRARNPTLIMVQFDRDNPEQEGEERHMSLGAVRNQMLEYHRVPGMGPRAERERARARLPQQPSGGWPQFDDVGVGNRRAEKLREAFKAMREIRDPREVTRAKIKDRLENALGESPPPRKAMKEFMHQLRSWVKQLAQASKEGGEPLRQQAQTYRAMQLKLDEGISQLDGEDRQERRDRNRDKERLTPDMDALQGPIQRRWDADARGKMKPVFARALQQLAGGTEFDGDFAKKLLKKLKDAGVPVEGTNRPMAVLALAVAAEQVQDRDLNENQQENLNAARAGIRREFGRLRQEYMQQREEEQGRQRKRQEAPARHQDRRELRGGGRKQMDSKAKLNSYFIGQVLPQGASDEAKAHAKEQLKKATYEDLEQLRKAASGILKNWDSDAARQHPLVKNLGYDREGLKKLKKLLKRKLGDVNGRQYHDDVLKMANKYDLESEDADALYDWRADKPGRGRALSDQEKMSRFLAKAKPETRERMQGMSLADFMVMYKSILKEVLDEDEEEVSQAA